MRFPLVQWRTLSAAVLIVAAVTATGWLIHPPVYLTNDDVAIRLALEGGAAPGEPATGFALFTHAALGWSIVAAQALLPRVPVWDLFVATVLLSAMAVLASIAWTVLGTDWLARCAAIGALLIPAAALLTGLHYTVAATLAGGASALLATVELGSGERPRRSMLAAAVMLIALGMLLRPMGALSGALAIGVVTIPLVFAGALRPVRAASMIAGVLAFFIGLQLLDLALYRQNRQWEEFYSYHAMVTRLFEWGGGLPAHDTQAVRTAVGWSSNDWMMLQAAFGVDPDLHGFTRLAKAYDTQQAELRWRHVLAAGASRLAQVGGDDLRRWLAASAGVVVVATVLAAAYATAGGAVAIAGAILLFLGFCLATEAVFKELPFRVLAPLHTCAVAALLVTAGALRRQRSAPASVLALGVLLALASTATMTAVSAAAADSRHSQQVEREVARLRDLSPSLVVLHADTFPSEHWWRPFHQRGMDLPMIALGWNNQSPLLQHYLSRSGRQPLLRALCIDPSVLIVGEEDRLEFVTTYLREHFGKAAEWNDVFAGSFRAWRCVSSPAAASPTS